MLAQVSTGLIRQATEPNLLAYQPHEKQLPFHQSNKMGRLYIGGNRSGKTVAGIVEDLWWCTKRHPYMENIYGEVRGRVIGVDFKKGIDEILLPVLKRWVVPSDLLGGSWEDSYSKADRKITFDNGSTIEFLSYEQELDKHAGTSRHFVHFDEEPPEEVFQENLLRILDTGGRFWITMTPVEGMTWVYDNLVEGKKEHLDIIEVNADDNPHLDSESKEAIYSFLSDEQVEIRKKGAFVDKGGRIFPNFTRQEPYVIPPVIPPKNWKRYVSIDSGFKNPAAILWHAVRPDGGKVITYKEIYLRGTTIKQLAAMIHEENKKSGEHIELYTGDPAMKQTSVITATSPLLEYSMAGIYLAVEGLPRDVQTGIDKMTNYLMIGKDGTPTWQVTQACPNLSRELFRYSWDIYSSSKTRDSKDPTGKPRKKDDHAIDAARYFFTRMMELPVVPKALEEASFDGLAGTYMEMAKRPSGLYGPWEDAPEQESETWW